MKLNTRFNYPKSKSSIVSGSRVYNVNGENLPSVTTILKATESEDKKESLKRWRLKIGDDEAERILKESSARGTRMHKHLEEYLIGQTKLDFEDDDSYLMSQKIINESLCKKFHEVWGSEVNLYYPKLYAGTADACGIYDGKESILDFKQSNKPKKREWITDYLFQVAAYSLAHNHIHKTNISQGVILICTPPPYVEFQEFLIENDELLEYQELFKNKVTQYKLMSSNAI